MTTLSERTMLATFHCSQWTARKLDKRVTQTLLREHGASDDAARVNKLLVAKSAIEEIGKVAGAARTYHYSVTLPWLHSGAQILPAELYVDYTDRMREYRERFEVAVDEFVSEYGRWRVDAKARLNGLWNADDYPPAHTIRARYAFFVGFSPLPDAADFRVQLADNDVAEIRRAIEDDVRTAVNRANRALWDRIHDVVAHLHERLAQTDAVFRDSLIQNVRDLVALLPALNVTNDPQLTAASAQLRDMVAGVEPATLRTVPSARARVADDAASMLAAMSAYTG